MALKSKYISLVVGMLLPHTAAAHSFGVVYNLPVPFWLYAWGAMAALFLSFLVVGIFASHPHIGANKQEYDLLGTSFVRLLSRLRLLTLARLISVAVLALCIAAGYWGTVSPYGNFNMTFFWVVFVLGFTYLSLLLGNFYALVNPWQILCNALAWLCPAYGKPRLHYPASWASWPAVTLYFAFIWVELLARNTPLSLAQGLSAYTLLNIVGVGVLGRKTWFQHWEFFSVFFRLIATLAPIHIRENGGHVQTLSLRPPFSTHKAEPAYSMSSLVFVLFMLASTAFDGLHSTLIWQRWYWVDFYHCCLLHYGLNPLAAFPKLRDTLLWWQSAWLLVAPILYLLVFGLFVTLSKYLGRSAQSVRALCIDFLPSLLPIALVYHISHYYTLIQSQGVKIIALASDPFGWGWNIFGSAKWMQRSIVPDPGTVWHVQVGLIVAGHIISVYMAHRIAIAVFPTPRRALLSQVPMLALMMLFTTAGLWILSQPLKAGVG